MKLTTLYDGPGTPSSPYLTQMLRTTYDGDLFFGDSSSSPLVFCNFVQTLDGIVSLKVPGKSGGAEISGKNQEDAFIMGVLRACADAVMIGEETFRNAPGHVWTAGCVYPTFVDEFQTFRKHIGKVSPHPLNVVVSGRGQVDLDQPLFRHTEIRSLVLTTHQGAAHLHQRYGASLPATVRVLPGETLLAPSDMIALLQSEYGIHLLLHEGGPTLLASFVERTALTKYFLPCLPKSSGGVRPVSGRPFLARLGWHPSKRCGERCCR